MSQELQTNNTNNQYFNPQAWNMMIQMADVFIKSNALPSTIKNAPQLMMVLQAGYEGGMKPIEAINAFYIINGKVTLYGAAAVAQVKKCGYKVEWGECNNDTATVTISKSKDDKATKTITIEEAKKLGWNIDNYGKTKAVWSKFPENMLRYKAFAFCARFYCPEALNGFYLKEEMDDVDVEESTKIETPKAETKKTLPPIKEPVKTEPKPQEFCESCGIDIAGNVVEFSVRNYKKKLCMNCQKELTNLPEKK